MARRACRLAQEGNDKQRQSGTGESFERKLLADNRDFGKENAKKENAYEETPSIFRPERRGQDDPKTQNGERIAEPA